MKSPIIALMMLPFLMACSMTPTGSIGLSVPVYSKDQRTAVHNELIGGCCPVTVEFMKDYKVLRDQVRVD